MGYKTVTELEWRCCPGFSGDNCHEGPISTPDDGMPPFKGAALPYRPGLKGYPHGPRPPVDLVPGGGQLEPGRPFPGVPDRGTVPTGQLPAGNGRPNNGEPTVSYKTSQFKIPFRALCVNACGFARAINLSHSSRLRINGLSSVSFCARRPFFFK